MIKRFRPAIRVALCLISIIGYFNLFAATPFEEKINKLKDLSKSSNSDEVFIQQNGKEIFSYTSNRFKDPILTMSCSKSVVAIAIGLAIDAGYIKNVNEPVFTYFPEWAEGDKKKIQVKHLLNHTSGLEADRTTKKLYVNSDFVKFALNSKLSNKPEHSFFYNNNATNILPGIILKATGMRMDKFLNSRLFTKLGIKESEWNWTLDKAGNPYGMSGLYMRPKAFAKIGQLILQNGIWNGEQIISQNWLNQMLTPSQNLEKGCGYLWWLKSDPKKIKIFFGDELIEKYKAAELPINVIKQLEKIRNQKFSRKNLHEKFSELFPDLAEVQKFFNEAKLKNLPDGQLEPGPTKAYVAEGHLGQYLVIIPEKKIVGVRLIHYTSANETTNFQEFVELLLKF